MDKYEYRMKADQIKKLIYEENYASAMKIADTIDWKRVKNVSMLCEVSDVYEKNEKYQESHELLLLAYDRSPIGRMMVYKLAELAIKMEDYEEAINYYREFVHLSPGDLAADILKYKIYKAKETSAEELIPIMEAFKEKEYHEEWAYELAHLYHEAGMGSKCIEECDDLILWFSEGKFVEKAMELKMLYKPLTPEQQEKYDHRNDEIEEITEYFDEEEEELAEIQNSVDKSKVVFMTEDMFTDEVDANDIQIKTINVGKYDTINLQAELAKSMEQIMSATEKESVDSTMENIRRLVEDSQIIDIKFDDELENNEIKPDFQVEIPTPIDYTNDCNQDKASYDKVLAEENDGQISLYMPEANILEKQITGQMRIEDVLNEWEKMKYAAQIAIKQAEQNRLNEVKSKALKKAENIMSKLSLIISEEEMKANGQEIVAAIEASFLEDEETLSQIAASLESEPSQIPNNRIVKNLEENQEEHSNRANGLHDIEKMTLEDIDLEEAQLSKEVDLDINEVSTENEATEVSMNDELQKEHNPNISTDKADIKKQYTSEIVTAELMAAFETKSDAESDFTISENAENKPTEKEDDSAAKAMEDKITANFPADLEAIIAQEFDEDSKEEIELQKNELQKNELQKNELQVTKSEETKPYIGGLTADQHDLFAGFLAVRGVEKALCNIFEPINVANDNNLLFEVNHVAITGKEQTGKTTLAMAIAKAAQMAHHKKSGKVAKISASSLNSKDINKLVGKMEGGVLIIEKAGNLTEKTIKALMETLREVKEEIMLILEDTKNGIDSVLSKDRDFANQIIYKVELPEYNNDELVEFGKEYAKTLMYSIDDMAILAFYTCLGNIQIDNVAITIEQVRAIIDAAISHSNKKKLKKLKDIITKKRYDEDKRVILQECDFENIR
ncbi:MAG: hypothetical protein ACERKZ_09135 [Lachnotalea sp.]